MAAPSGVWRSVSSTSQPSTAPTGSRIAYPGPALMSTRAGVRGARSGSSALHRLEMRGLQGAGGARRRLAAPEVVDQAVDGHDLAARGEQQRHDRPLPESAEIGCAPVHLGLERPENADPDVPHSSAA